MRIYDEAWRRTSFPEHFQQFLLLQNKLSCTIKVTKDVKSLNKLIPDSKCRSVVDVKLDKLLQIDAGHICSCFSKLAEFDLVFYVSDLVKN